MVKVNKAFGAFAIFLLCMTPADAADPSIRGGLSAHARRMLEIINYRTRLEYGPQYDRLSQQEKQRLQREGLERYRSRSQAEKHRMSLRDRSMTFYGRVRDNSGRPVPYAVVTVAVQRESFAGEDFPIRQTCLRQASALSGEDGFFVFEDLHGWRLQLQNIEAEGYAYFPANQPALVFFPLRHPSNLKAPYFFRENPKFPVVFHLEKIANPTRGGRSRPGGDAQ